MKNKKGDGMKMYRQGDLLIIKISDLPIGLTRQNDNVLALGEATGHKHELIGKAETYYLSNTLRTDESRTDKYFIAEETVTLRHDEHKPVELQKGTYLVVRQREYNPQTQRNEVVPD